MTTSIKILPGSGSFPFCTTCVQSKMTRQPHRDPHIPSEVPGFRIHADVGGSANVYATWKGYKYFILFVCDAIEAIEENGGGTTMKKGVRAAAPIEKKIR